MDSPVTLTNATDIKRYRVTDFETTGFPPEADIVEIGWSDVLVLDGIPQIPTAWTSELTKPRMKIEIAAMAVHHILEADVFERRKPDEVLTEISVGVDAFCAHNAKFEKQFFKTDIPWICTLKAAYLLCPKSPNHQNQTLRYFLNHPVDPNDCMPSHRAGPDAYVTAWHLWKFLSARTVEQLIAIEREPAELPKCPMGKYRGQPWAEVDMGYLQWCLRQPTMEEDIVHTVQKEIARRRA